MYNSIFQEFIPKIQQIFLRRFFYSSFEWVRQEFLHKFLQDYYGELQRFLRDFFLGFLHVFSSISHKYNFMNLSTDGFLKEYIQM